MYDDLKAQLSNATILGNSQWLDSGSKELTGLARSFSPSPSFQVLLPQRLAGLHPRSFDVSKSPRHHEGINSLGAEAARSTFICKMGEWETTNRWMHRGECAYIEREGERDTSIS